MSRVLNALDAIERGLIASLTGFALVLACYSMGTRYLMPAISVDWAFEVIIFLIIWAMFLAAARLIDRGGHIRIDIVLSMVSPATRRVLALIAALLGLVVALLLFWSGWTVVEEAVRWREYTSSTLRLPLWVYYASLPTGAALLAIRLVAQIFRLFTGRQIDSSDHSPAG
ncbi:MAG: TRAP transporter small permease subunit [Microvirga sp.]|nr:TRAP transporter small permease subunit [Microvirga sp.]